MESKWNEINWRSYFYKESYRKSLECTSGKKGGAHEGGGRAHPPRVRPLPRGPPSVHRHASFTHIYLRILKLPEQTIDREFRRQKSP